MPSSRDSFCALFSLKHPLIQAPMAGVQGSRLTIAASQTGAMGSLPCAMLTPEQMDSEIRAIRAATDRPYNLNFFCHIPPPPDVASDDKQAAWRDALAPYYADYGIDPGRIAAGAGRAPFSDALCELIEAHRPPVVSFHFGLPAAHLVQRIKRWGGKVISSATTVAEAQWLQAHGADAIIAHGLEAGGHRGMFLRANTWGTHAGLSSDFPSDWRTELSSQQGSFTLLPQIVSAVQLPVIAAGGIVDSATVRAAFALGASAVQIGTAFMLCDEASTSPLHRQALAHSAAHPQQHHTQLTSLFTGRPARGIRNRLMQEMGELNPLAPAFPTSTAALAPLRAAAEQAGKSDFTPLWSGQNARGCKAVPASQLIAELMAS
jgi:nitronate monooxygenase